MKIVYQVCYGVNRRMLYRREVADTFKSDNKEFYFDRVLDARRHAKKEAQCGLWNARDRALKNEYRSHLRELSVPAHKLPLLKLNEPNPYMGGGRNGYGEWDD